jgi:membrane protease YdiL (CAAX protease family)
MLSGNVPMRKAKEIAVSLLAIAFAVIIPHAGLVPFPFGYCIPVLFVAWLVLKLNKENFTNIGFSVKDISIKTLLVGIVSAILLFAFLTEVFFPLIHKLTDLPPVDLGDIANIKGNTGFYIFLLAMGWLVGGLYEEIIFHGFIFTRLEKLFPVKYAATAAFIVCNIIFALYHFQLGTEGVINAFIAGCVYQALMLQYKRNMWYAIFCHAVYDTIALTYIYAGF